MSEVDKTYREVVKDVLSNGNYKENRTNVSTISKFGVDYSVDVSGGFPLLTTKEMGGGVWDSLVHELLWYLSGEHHIKNLKEHTSIWDEWADEKDRLETAYGRYWRRFPTINRPLGGENWTEMDSDWINTERGGNVTFDQIQYVIDNIKENPNSRRHVVSAWHPENAATSKLPPCHLLFIFNVQGSKLNLHLTQRSGDIALGVPFNIASYSLLLKMVAKEVGLQPGHFKHSITDAHIYCGKGDRGSWYEDMDRMGEVKWGNISILKNDIENNAPEQDGKYDHIPGLLEQIQRVGNEAPEVNLHANKVDKFNREDIELKNYNSHDRIKFDVAV